MSAKDDDIKATSRRRQGDGNETIQPRTATKSPRRERIDPYAPMTGSEFMWVVRRAGIRQRHAAERMGVTVRTLQRWGMLSAVPSKYVVALASMAGGRPMLASLRNEYAEIMALAYGIRNLPGGQ